MKEKTVFQQIIRWEKIRLLFNLAMLLSGVLVIVIINQIKYVKMFGYYCNSHHFNWFYTEVIIFYALLINLFYTSIYTYFILLVKKLNLDTERQKILESTTIRYIFVIGLSINLITGLLELVYRLT